MKFTREIRLIVEGEVFENSSPEDLLKRINWSWTNWWENNPNWPYGKPSDLLQGGVIKKVYLENNMSIDGGK